MDERTRRAAAILAALIFLNLAVIWGSSTLPMETSSQQSSFITSLLIAVFGGADHAALEHIVRKCAHFCEFASLGALSLGLTYTISKYDIRITWSRTAVPVFGCLLAASTDEMIQIFSGRGNSVSDVMLDFSGSLTAMFIFFVVLLIAGSRHDRSTDIDDGQ